MNDVVFIIDLVLLSIGGVFLYLFIRAVNRENRKKDQQLKKQ